MQRVLSRTVGLLDGAIVQPPRSWVTNGGAVKLQDFRVGVRLLLKDPRIFLGGPCWELAVGLAVCLLLLGFCPLLLALQTPKWPDADDVYIVKTAQQTLTWGLPGTTRRRCYCFPRPAQPLA